jgi:hypothetical protein
MINEKFKNVIFNKAYLIILLYFFFHLLSSRYLEFYYDDWYFLSIFNNNSSFIENFHKLRDIYLVRPVGLIYLTFLSLFEYEKIFSIYISNIFIWILSGLIIVKSVKKKLPNFSDNFFLAIFLFPSISTTLIYSPIIQGLSTISIFLWSISIWFISKPNNNFNILISIFFILLSMLSYELTVSLLPINVFLYAMNKKIIYKKLKVQLLLLIKIILIFLILIFTFYLIQNFLGSYSDTTTIKYGFFEKDFFTNLKKYFFKPITLIFIEIPSFWYNGFFSFLLNYKLLDLFIIILINILLFTEIKKIKVCKDLSLIVFYNLTLGLVFIGIFLVYLIATSVPDLNGYYNRGLLGLHVCLTFFLIQLNQYQYVLKKTFMILSILIINLNLISFLEQSKIHKENSFLRQEIINKTGDIINNEKLIFTNFTTYSKNKYGLIPIFSDEVYDYANSISYRYKGKFIGHRVYKDFECKKILNFKDGFLKGMVPSRNKKIREGQLIDFIKIDENLKNTTNIVIYDYVTQSFRIGKIHDLNNLLSEVFGCN